MRVARRGQASGGGGQVVEPDRAAERVESTAAAGAALAARPAAMEPMAVAQEWAGGEAEEETQPAPPAGPRVRLVVAAEDPPGKGAGWQAWADVPVVPTPAAHVVRPAPAAGAGAARPANGATLRAGRPFAVAGATPPAPAAT